MGILALPLQLLLHLHYGFSFFFRQGPVEVSGTKRRPFVEFDPSVQPKEKWRAYLFSIPPIFNFHSSYQSFSLSNHQSLSISAPVLYCVPSHSADEGPWTETSCTLVTNFYAISTFLCGNIYKKISKHIAYVCVRTRSFHMLSPIDNFILMITCNSLFQVYAYIQQEWHIS